MKQDKNSRNAILGVVLGDGHLDKNGSVSIKHCKAQEDYLHWKVQYIKSVGIKCGGVKQINNNGFPGVHAYISVTRWGKFLRRYLWKDGYKNIYKRKLLNRLSPIHLAIWYMDDGGLSQKKRDGAVHANELFLNTCTTQANNQVIIDYFIEVHGVKFTQVKNRGRYRLRAGTKAARIFLNLVREYVLQVPSMQHKLKIISKGSYDL